jgi:hypothetical protein
MLTLITDHFRNIKKNICCTKLFVKNISKILSFILLDDHLSNSLFKFNALWNRTFFDGLGILKPQYISFSFIYNSACNNKTPTEVIFMHILERRALYYTVDSSCKKPLVICNSIFSIFLNQIKAQKDLKIIVWIEYFPYKYSFKVISND